jgi:hypothetical protein
MSKSWPYVLMLGLAGVFFAAAVVFWLNDPGTSGRRPLPKDPALALRPITEPSDELALPINTIGPDDVVVREVSVWVGTVWYLDLHPDGTARLGFGAADVWAVEPGAMDYLGTVQALRAVARKAGYPGGRQYHVHFQVDGRPIRGYTQDSKLVLDLLDRAAGALQHPNARFGELWMTHPPSKVLEVK